MKGLKLWSEHEKDFFGRIVALEYVERKNEGSDITKAWDNARYWVTAETKQ